ncbi:MAG TPA: hypothetical protein HPP83_05610 [Candidatus Hydrogenedentes bacterium]|nr:hypothetical protein [Candidatus Hydrogenedentota bacterium]
MLRKWSIVLVLLGFGAAYAADEDIQLDLELTANKSTYVFGEPMMLRTLIRNVGTETSLKVNTSWAGPGSGDWGFSFLVAKDDGEFHNFLGALPFGVATPPRQFETYGDDQCLSGRYLTPNEPVRRTDIFFVSPPGSYRLKAQLKEDGGRTWQSQELSLDVIPVAGNDSITKVLDAERVGALGWTICISYHHLGGTGSGTWSHFLPDSDPDLFCVRVLEGCPDSVFCEYLRFVLARRALYECTFLRRQHNRAIGREIDYITPVETFLRDYPDSWLIPCLITDFTWIDLNQPGNDPNDTASFLAPYLDKEGEPEEARFVQVRKAIDKRLARQAP